MTDEDRVIYDAWREAEHYQVPMTTEGADLAERRWKAFQKGWKAAENHFKQFMDEGCFERGCACMSFNYSIDEND